jgi:hypothetical protein
MQMIIIALVLNSVACLAMYLTQQWEVKKGKLLPHGSMIPGTNQVFLHWQDFYCQRYGCTLGLPFVAATFLELWTGGYVTTNQLLFTTIVALIGTVGFEGMCLSDGHKPDWGFPEKGKVSYGGLIHAVYWGLNVGMVIICIYHLLITGNLDGPVRVAALIGGAIYIGSNLCDIKSGNFAQIASSGIVLLMAAAILC